MRFHDVIEVVSVISPPRPKTSRTLFCRSFMGVEQLSVAAAANLESAHYTASRAKKTTIGSVVEPFGQLDAGSQAPKELGTLNSRLWSSPVSWRLQRRNCARYQ